MSIIATIELDQHGYQELPRELAPTGEGLIYGQDFWEGDVCKELDAIATVAGARAITTFFYSAEEFEGVDEEELPPEADNWSPIADGMDTFQALVHAIEKRSEDSRIVRRLTAEVLWDLRACLMTLKNAPSPSERFRTDVG